MLHRRIHGSRISQVQMHRFDIEAGAAQRFSGIVAGTRVTRSEQYPIPALSELACYDKTYAAVATRNEHCPFHAFTACLLWPQKRLDRAPFVHRAISLG